MGSHRRLLLNAAGTLLCMAVLFGAVAALADSIKRFFYSVRVVTGTLAEAQTYYAVTGAPATLDEWMTKYNFPARGEGETLDAYRQRVGIVVYYNETELGLGRELGCSTFQDVGPSGAAQPGLACFVTNYGERFQDGDKALIDAIDAKRRKNTVGISYAPSSTPPPSGLGNGVVPAISAAVNFAVYGESGFRNNTSTLDMQGHGPVPGICTNCHGGTYDARDHLVIGGQFTPINPSILTFSSMAGYTLADQEARIAALNTLMATVPRCGTSP